MVLCAVRAKLMVISSAMAAKALLITSTVMGSMRLVLLSRFMVGSHGQGDDQAAIDMKNGRVAGGKNGG